MWDDALAMGERQGVRNSQATVLAPTGTIAFMMDCDTTGIEPDIALVKYKKLVGGGMLKIVNKTVPRALRRLGYEKREIQDIVEYIDEQETIEGAPHLRDEHLAGLRLRLQARNAASRIDPLSRPHPHDGRGAAVHLGRDLQDRQHADRCDRRRHRPRPTSRPGGYGLKASRSIATAASRRSRSTRARSVERQAQGSGRGARPVRRRLPNDCKSRAPQVRDRRARGLHPRRLLRGRHAGRDLHQDGQGGQHDLRPDGHDRDPDLDGAAVRRAARGAGQQVRARALRAVGLHQESRDPDGEVADRLHLPLPRLALRRTSGGSAAAAAAAVRRAAGWSASRVREAGAGGSRAETTRRLHPARRMRRPARTAARSWCATALATNVSIAARPAAAPETPRSRWARESRAAAPARPAGATARRTAARQLSRSSQRVPSRRGTRARPRRARRHRGANVPATSSNRSSVRRRSICSLTSRLRTMRS